MDWINAKETMPPKFDRFGWYVKINNTVKTVLSHDEILKRLHYCNSIFWLDETKSSKSETIAPNTETMKAKVGKIMEEHLNNLENLMGIKKANRVKETLGRCSRH